MERSAECRIPDLRFGGEPRCCELLSVALGVAEETETFYGDEPRYALSSGSATA